MTPSIPKNISHGISMVNALPNVLVSFPGQYVVAELAWAFDLTIENTEASSHVPASTNWVLLVDPHYPAGEIRLFPANKGGLRHTFPHQDRNVECTKSHSWWWLGKPCLDSPIQRLSRIAGGPEPKADAELRLRWHIERASDWLTVAALDFLMDPAEPFETPQCPAELLDERFLVVHDEGADSLEHWNGRIGKMGLVHWDILSGIKNTILAGRFLDSEATQIRTSRRSSDKSAKPWVGFWWLWPAPAVLCPWHAPSTWGQLRAIGREQRIDVDRTLRAIVRRAPKEEVVILLIGYQIPALWAGKPIEVHWQALILNIPKKVKPQRGYRDNDRGRWERLRREKFGNHKMLSYLTTSSWHPDRLQARGRLDQSLREQAIVIIGVGALGSAIAEILARGGVQEICVLDGDTLAIGNLSRHTLTASELSQNKAQAVAARLQLAAPMSTIKSISRYLPEEPAQAQELLADYDVILDCTAEDGVLRTLASGWWPIPKVFLSASTGFAATRLFLYFASANSFPLDDFAEEIGPWLSKERQEWANAGEVLEGPGCWSPLYPARNDDIGLAAIASVKHLENTLTSEASPHRLCVYEKQDDGILGYKRAVVAQGGD